MTFYERYEMLCAERSMKAQTQEILDIAGVSSPSVSGWKNGSMPKADVLCRLSKYFGVTTDYLLGLSEVRKNCTIPAWLNTLGEKNNVNFSGVLQEALQKKLNIAE